VRAAILQAGGIVLLGRSRTAREKRLQLLSMIRRRAGGRALSTAPRLVVPVGLAIALTGCGAIGAIDLPWRRERPPPPPVASTAPAPVAPVESSNLPPPNQGTTPAPASTAMTAPTGEAAATQPLPQPDASGAPPPTTGLGRTDLLGGWTITSAGDSCQLFMTLTSWTGGYRASTRGCASDLLKSISAWNLQGNQVILAGQGGTPLARLQSAGNNRFDGSAVSGAATVSFYR